eukprot:362013-Chlamydomonas_euryale.AAC.2
MLSWAGFHHCSPPLLRSFLGRTDMWMVTVGSQPLHTKHPPAPAMLSRKGSRHAHTSSCSSVVECVTANDTSDPHRTPAPTLKKAQEPCGCWYGGALVWGVGGGG